MLRHTFSFMYHAAFVYNQGDIIHSHLYILQRTSITIYHIIHFHSYILQHTSITICYFTHSHSYILQHNSITIAISHILSHNYI